jgi:hypothetical protein
MTSWRFSANDRFHAIAFLATRLPDRGADGTKS